ncbi:MAG: aldo/keto reductase, partial [Myxococcales bacterium]|nr:aldo/keto reductase [Myxococcales bacterium]
MKPTPARSDVEVTIDPGYARAGMGCDWNRVTLGRSGVEASAMGVGSSFGIQSPDLEYAFERGMNYFYWGSIRTSGFGKAVRALAQRHREQMVIVVQSYTRIGALMRGSVEGALRKLGTDYADFLLLGWWNESPPERIFDAARALRERGKVRHLMISCHNRLSFPRYAQHADIGALMVRYNAAHPGAETEVFPLLGERPPGVVAYTATRWTDLFNPSLTPAGEPTPRVSDCYRFCLTHPAVDTCIFGPRNRADLDEALSALDRGPMDEEELAWMRRVGAAVKKRSRPNSAGIGL